ncbi:ethanolamine-phosphate cytidylyltransferase, putative, partial [Plasmodium malariae]
IYNSNNNNSSNNNSNNNNSNNNNNSSNNNNSNNNNSNNNNGNNNNNSSNNTNSGSKGYLECNSDPIYGDIKDINSSPSNNSEEINEYDLNCSTSTLEKNNKSTRIYVDGIFDLSHSGHFNAMRQAKKLGDIVVVGINSDEDALNSKGVMPIYTQEERGALIAGCKWVDEVIVGTKYTVSMELLEKYNCDYAAHGSDVAYDRNGKCCYEEVRKNNKLKIFERSYGISSTTIINHLLQAVNSGNNNNSSSTFTANNDNSKNTSTAMSCNKGTNNNLNSCGDDNNYIYNQDEADSECNNINSNININTYSTNCVNGSGEKINFKKCKINPKELEEQFKNTEIVGTDNVTKLNDHISNVKNSLNKNKCYVTASQLYQFMENHDKKKKHRVVYVDGSFDIFHIGHLKILENAKKLGDYLLVGMHSDDVVRTMKGKYFPVVSLLERTLNVLAMKVVDDVVIGAPWVITESFIKRFHIDVVVRGTIVDYVYSHNEIDPYTIPKKLNIFRELSSES